MMRTSGAIRAVNQTSGSRGGDGAGWRQRLSGAGGDMFIKVRVTSLNQCFSQQEDWSVASNTDLIIGVPPAKINH